MEINVEIWVALIGASALLIGYLIQNQNELKLKITEKKRDAYTEFLKGYIEVIVAVDHDIKIDQIELHRQRKLQRNQLLLYASDNVIKAYDNWAKYSQIENDKDENPEIEDDNTDVGLFGIMLLEIRKDILGKTLLGKTKTKLTVEDINNLNPVTRP